MASSGFMKIACAVLLSMVVVAPYAEAISCGQVASALGQCITYVRKGGVVPPGCCTGIKTLNSAARTTPDRQTTCKCLQSAAGNIAGINYGLVAGLPSKCKVYIPYKLSPSTDCSKVK